MHDINHLGMLYIVLLVNYLAVAEFCLDQVV
jgi:hypothetical protein